MREHLMDIIEIRDKERIERFLRRNTPMHLYELGDLDDDFFPDTHWFAGVYEDKLIALALLYSGLSVPNFIALDQGIDALRDLLIGLRKMLPGQFYSHLSLGLESAFNSRYKLENHGPHFKMILSDRLAVRIPDISQVVRLDRSDVVELISLYQESYPDSWFDSDAFKKGIYAGIRLNNRLISVAGTHVYSEKYKLAALGNITTHPGYRNQGYGRKVVAGLCAELSEEVDHIGLNVKASNKSAITLYENLGFQKIGTYKEYMVTK